MSSIRPPALRLPSDHIGHVAEILLYFLYNIILIFNCEVSGGRGALRPAARRSSVGEARPSRVPRLPASRSFAGRPARHRRAGRPGLTLKCSILIDRSWVGARRPEGPRVPPARRSVHAMDRVLRGGPHGTSLTRGCRARRPLAVRHSRRVNAVIRLRRPRANPHRWAIFMRQAVPDSDDRVELEFADGWTLARIPGRLQKLLVECPETAPDRGRASSAPVHGSETSLRSEDGWTPARRS